MGSNAIISVLGFLIVFTIVDASMNKSNLRSYENTYGYAKYRSAREIARNSIQITLRKIDSKDTVKSSDFPVSGNINDGTYSVAGTVIGTDSLRLTATSVFSDTSYTIKTTLYRQKIPLPPSLFKGAFGVYSDSLNVLGFTSNKDSIDGRDHDIEGNLLPLSTDTVPPVQVRTTLDSSVVYAGVVAGAGLDHLMGTPKIKVDPAMTNPNTTSDQFKVIADSLYTISNGGSMNIGNGNVVMSDSINPIIVFCDGTNKTTGKTDGSFKLLCKDGYGILVVKGNLSFAGGATWHGAVIEYGNIPLTLSASSGNSQVYGGVLFGGANGGTYDLKGNSKFFHSSAALNLRNKIKDPFIYQIVDWYE